MIRPTNRPGFAIFSTALALFGGLFAASAPIISAGPAVAQAALPFWSRPYPYYYARVRPHCATVRREVGPSGEVHYVRVWDCNPFTHAPS